jgi:tetratricopeptide (TPR) repeat protein
MPAQIGPYGVDREIGRGGMGVVYLAHDQRLDREVAIKCLPDDFAADAERLERFDREARHAQAHEAYLRGLHAWRTGTSEGGWDAIHYFEEAIRADSGFARAYAGIADVWTGMASWNRVDPERARGEALQAARKALDLDPTQPDAHAAMAFINLTLEWDWAAAESSLRQALDHAPDHAWAHHLYGHLFSLLGRDDEAVFHMKEALRVEPLVGHHAMCAGSTYIAAGRYAEADRALADAIEWAPGDPAPHYYRGWLAERRGYGKASIDEYAEARTLAGDDLYYTAMLAVVEARHGDRERARAFLQQILDRPEDVFVASADVAKVYAALGHTAEAMKWLDRAYTTRDSSWLPFALTGAEPGLESLLDEPRVKEMLDELGLSARRDRE